MKRTALFIVFLSIILLVACSKAKIVLINSDFNNEILQEIGFSKGSYFGWEIDMVDNKNEIVANYIETLNKEDALERYIIIDYVAGKIYKYASAGSRIW